MKQAEMADSPKEIIESIRLKMDAARPLTVRPDEVMTNPDNPRPSDIKFCRELAANIKEVGQIHEPIVRPVLPPQGKIKWVIVEGSCRWEAVHINVKEDPERWNFWHVKEAQLTREEAMVICQAENIQRKDLDPISEALGWQRVGTMNKMNQRDLAETFGTSQTEISRKTALLKLPQTLQDMIQRRIIPVLVAALLPRYNIPKAMQLIHSSWHNDGVPTYRETHRQIGRLLEDRLHIVTPSSEDPAYDKKANWECMEYDEFDGFPKKDCITCTKAMKLLIDENGEIVPFDAKFDDDKVYDTLRCGDDDCLSKKEKEYEKEWKDDEADIERMAKEAKKKEKEKKDKKSEKVEKKVKKGGKRNAIETIEAIKKTYPRVEKPSEIKIDDITANNIPEFEKYFGKDRRAGLINTDHSALHSQDGSKRPIFQDFSVDVFGSKPTFDTKTCQISCPFHRYGCRTWMMTNKGKNKSKILVPLSEVDKNSRLNICLNPSCFNKKQFAAKKKKKEDRATFESHIIEVTDKYYHDIMEQRPPGLSTEEIENTLISQILILNKIAGHHTQKDNPIYKAIFNVLGEMGIFESNWELTAAKVRTKLKTILNEGQAHRFLIKCMVVTSRVTDHNFFTGHLNTMAQKTKLKKVKYFKMEDRYRRSY